jgi:hypothetical protein
MEKNQIKLSVAFKNNLGLSDEELKEPILKPNPSRLPVKMKLYVSLCANFYQNAVIPKFILLQVPVKAMKLQKKKKKKKKKKKNKNKTEVHSAEKSEQSVLMSKDGSRPAFCL